jgi:ATP synthase protein I
MTDTLHRGRDAEAVDEWAYKTLTHDEAQALKAKLPMLSPWRVVAAQAIAGVLCCAVVLVVTQRGSAGWSALYGAAAVVLPSMLLARGMTKRTRSAVAAAAGFMFWETLKIGVAVAMLVIAARVVKDLSWPALLATMVVCMKVNWLALLWRGRVKNIEGR